MKHYTQFIVSGRLCLPECKPDLECILRLTAKPQLEDVCIRNRAVHFSGHVYIECEYVADMPDCSQPVHFVAFDLPFNGSICDGRLRECMQVQLQSSIRRQEVNILQSRSFKSVVFVRVGLLKLTDSRKPIPQHICQADMLICRECRTIAAVPELCSKSEDLPDNETSAVYGCETFFDNIQLCDYCEPRCGDTKT